MTLRDDLIAAKALIDTPEKWCKGADFRKVPHFAGTATFEVPCRVSVTMCARTAAVTVATIRRSRVVETLIEHLPPGYGSIPAFNDARGVTHADIMALFDRAIEAAS